MAEIKLKNDPEIPGLRFRHPEDESDLSMMYPLWQAYQDAEGTNMVKSEEDFRKTYLTQTNFNYQEDILLTEVADDLIGYAFTRWYNMPLEDAISFTIVVYVSPAWQRKGLGTTLLRWGEEKVAREAAAHPAEKAKFIRCYAHSTQEGKQAILKKTGYRQIDEYAHMVRPLLDDIPAIAAPEGITFSPLDVKDARKLWEAIQEAFQDHVDYQEQTEQDFTNWQDTWYFQPELMCVAWDGEEIAGQIMNYINHEENAKFNRKRGYTEWISVRRPWRRHGLARAMLAHSLKMFKEMGMTEAALDVHVTNPHEAFALYHSLGFESRSGEFAYQKDII